MYLIILKLYFAFLIKLEIRNLPANVKIQLPIDIGNFEFLYKLQISVFKKTNKKFLWTQIKEVICKKIKIFSEILSMSIKRTFKINYDILNQHYFLMLVFFIYGT